MSDNPLLSVFKAPNQAPPFDEIRPHHFLPALQEAIETARRNIQDIKENSAEPDFENTIVALEVCDEDLRQVMSIYHHLLGTVGIDELHALSDKIGPLAANFTSDIILDPDLFDRVKNVYKNTSKEDLTFEQWTLLDETFESFRRGGAQLNDEDKQTLREINEQLSLLGPSFMQNVNKSSEQFSLWVDAENDLTGLPEGVRETAKSAAEEEGYPDKWMFSLDISTFLPFMQYAENRTLREKFWRGFTSRGFEGDFDNQDNIMKIIDIRHKRATLLD